MYIYIYMYIYVYIYMEKVIKAMFQTTNHSQNYKPLVIRACGIYLLFLVTAASPKLSTAQAPSHLLQLFQFFQDFLQGTTLVNGGAMANFHR